MSRTQPGHDAPLPLHVFPDELPPADLLDFPAAKLHRGLDWIANQVRTTDDEHWAFILGKYAVRLGRVIAWKERKII